MLQLHFGLKPLDLILLCRFGWRLIFSTMTKDKGSADKGQVFAADENNKGSNDADEDQDEKHLAVRVHRRGCLAV